MENRVHRISWQTELRFWHEDVSQYLILGLFALSVITELVGWPWVFKWLWVIPTFGYLLGRMAVENYYCPPRDYWLLALGSQVIVAIMVGVPLLILYG